ncbi:MAG: hypothetical protein Q9161_009115 [Pseudevernia consocians]
MNGLFSTRLLKKVNAGIICADQPGLDLSTPSPDWKLLDNPDTIAQFAQHLGLNSYRDLSWSGGESFALACAKALSKEQPVRVGVLASQHGFPSSCVYFENGPLCEKLAQNPDPEVLQRYMKGQMKPIRGQEKKKMEDLLANNPDAMEIMTEHIRQHFRQGAAKYIREVQIIIEPWAFILKEIETEVVLLYGTADMNVLVRVGREMAKTLGESGVEGVGWGDAFHDPCASWTGDPSRILKGLKRNLGLNTTEDG